MTMMVMMLMTMIVRLVRYGHGDRCVGDDYCMLLGYILGAAMSRKNPYMICLESSLRRCPPLVAIISLFSD